MDLPGGDLAAFVCQLTLHRLQLAVLQSTAASSAPEGRPPFAAGSDVGVKSLS